MDERQPVDIANLLEHSTWLRRLAGSLVFDRDDSIQDVWVAALRAPPDVGRPPQPWLSRVLKNSARRRHRDASVRQEHEERAATAPTPNVPTPEELLAHAETQRLLAELVAGLSEPYRRVVLLRYYEGLSAAQIARALGRPAGTVRWQLKEGLDRLRGGLDARFANDRHGWSLALAPLAAVPGGQSGTTAAGLMTAKTKFAAIVLPLLMIVFTGIAWRSGHPSASKSWAPETPTTPLPLDQPPVKRAAASPDRAAYPASSAARTSAMATPTGSGLARAVGTAESAPVVRTLLEPPAGRAEGASSPATRPWDLPTVNDRRHRPGSRAESELEAISYAFQTLDEDLDGCLAQWGTTEQHGPQEVMVAFQISKDGLKKAWTVDGNEVPPGPRTCLASVVHGLDWANIVDEPAEVTKLFKLRPDADGR